MFTVFLITFLITVLAFFYLKKSAKSQDAPNKAATEENVIIKQPASAAVVRRNTRHDKADIMTSTGPGNTCVAIFKNPWDRMTHFYRTRLKGNLDCDGCPLQFRNVAASLRLWGCNFENIHSIRISEPNCSCFEEPSKWIARLEDQREDCQTKFGCRIEFMDFQMMKDPDKKVFGDLSQKILENCISEDDFHYFQLQD